MAKKTPPSVASKASRRPVGAHPRAHPQVARALHANDNIAKFIEPGELAELQDEVEAKMRRVLESLVIDTDSDHKPRTPPGAWRRCTSTRCSGPLRGRAPSPSSQHRAAERADDRRAHHREERLLHHLCPSSARCGSASCQRALQPHRPFQVRALCDWVMSRPQIQEEAVTRLRPAAVQDAADGLAVVMEADHFCMQWRGVKDSDSKMVNSVMRGSFLKDPNCAASSRLLQRKNA